uniref:Uncharacterized protein n=1 Tax=Anguilla anguilla TaxID=7936 RepID=A0A0E9S2D1_ANGAN
MLSHEAGESDTLMQWSVCALLVTTTTIPLVRLALAS